MLGDFEMLTEVDVAESGHDAERAGATDDEHHRQRQRPVTEELRQPRGEENDHAHDDCGQGVTVHRDTSPAPVHGGLATDHEDGSTHLAARSTEV